MKPYTLYQLKGRRNPIKMRERRGGREGRGGTEGEIHVYVAPSMIVSVGMAEDGLFQKPLHLLYNNFY